MTSLLRLFPLAVLCAFGVAVSLLLPASSPASADAPNVLVPVALAPVQRDTPVELVALILDARITEYNGHTLVTGNSTFKLHNTDKMNGLQTAVGFPAWAGDPYMFDPTRMISFTFTLEGKKVALTSSRADFKVGSTVRNVDWYTFTLGLAADEKKTARIEFQQDLGEGIFPRFVYGMLPAATWKGSIGSARLSLSFPDDTTLEQLISYEPSSATTFDGASITWHFATREPPSNPTLTLIRPTIWNELLARRRAIHKNPNDAPAHAALGTLLRQFATIDSPRRDGFYAQAIAELEAATRLDPNQRSARQTLASLYESRAGPAAGPRQANYVLLAVAQWQALASSDASARKQLAEDYFYLGIDAQTRGAFGDAMSYYDKASATQPGGAGPLFTPDRANAQRRSLSIAWARTLLDQGDIDGARSQARTSLGETFMNSFSAPSFYFTRARVTTASGSRSMAFHLSPYAATSTSVQKGLDEVVTSLQTAGVEADTTNQAGEFDLTIKVPFGNGAELRDALASVARKLPDRPEWALARAAAFPTSLVWETSGGFFTDSVRYSESLDLAVVCSIVDKNLQALSSSLKPLEAAPVTDQEAQLKRGLLKNAQDGWERTKQVAHVVFRAGETETVVEPCTSTTIASSASPLRIEFLAIAASVVGLASMGIVYLGWRRLRIKRNRERVVQRASR